eukprot:CAMPEP_0175069278 /NCGR_PEP_ID=MMETSP0052_2-20121109/18112_1 /TAXON_ID=51329 ORGANISM="Polytomella parva, Strain SAG 63-3" /NCGR_SAMPLE_ID=MMETSP0052_2 /ASSEMBLY_ACC=CAM_ASM_000194 /LENGTH=60 /DNA_ID=CAMNT_0016336347 /DNA_START=384 /DNA_END=563 /DNA_ORIENTATION=+
MNSSIVRKSSHHLDLPNESHSRLSGPNLDPNRLGASLRKSSDLTFLSTSVLSPHQQRKEE